MHRSPKPVRGRPAFGPLLRRFRLRADLSQGTLAERAGTSVEAVSALERSVRLAPYRKTVAGLSKALKLVSADRKLLEAAAVRPPRPRRYGEE